jgi:hypothetical protein
MTIPWDDWVTATIDHDGSRSIIAEGPLCTIVVNLATKSLDEQQRIVLAFSDRSAPPYRMDGDQISPLARQLLIREDVAKRAKKTNSPAA